MCDGFTALISVTCSSNLQQLKVFTFLAQLRLLDFPKLVVPSLRMELSWSFLMLSRKKNFRVLVKKLLTGAVEQRGPSALSSRLPVLFQARPILISMSRREEVVTSFLTQVSSDCTGLSTERQKVCLCMYYPRPLTVSRSAGSWVTAGESRDGFLSVHGVWKCFGFRVCFVESGPSIV